MKLTPEKQANKWIKEMTEMGMTPDQMSQVFKNARIKLAELKERKVKFEMGDLRSLTDQEILIAKAKLEKTNRVIKGYEIIMILSTVWILAYLGTALYANDLFWINESGAILWAALFSSNLSYWLIKNKSDNNLK